MYKLFGHRSVMFQVFLYHTPFEKWPKHFTFGPHQVLKKTDCTLSCVELLVAVFTRLLHQHSGDSCKTQHENSVYSQVSVHIACDVLICWFCVACSSGVPIQTHLGMDAVPVSSHKCVNCRCGHHCSSRLSADHVRIHHVLL
jgi:hypothetical protein